MVESAIRTTAKATRTALRIGALLSLIAREPRVEPGGFAEGPPHGIILLSIDTLRADYVGAYGYDRFDTTPSLDEFARDAVLFENCIVTEPKTLTSHMSLFTGLHPHEHGVGENAALSEGIPTLAEILNRHGYRTAAFTDGGWMSHRWGFQRGFRLFYEGNLSGLASLGPSSGSSRTEMSPSSYSFTPSMSTRRAPSPTTRSLAGGDGSPPPLARG